MNGDKLIKISLVINYVFMLILAVFTVGLPWMVTWYVETMGRSASLPATIMVACYPCVPFVAGILYFLRKILKSSLKNEFFSDINILRLRNMSHCSIAVAIITLIAGRYYLPFYIVAGTFGFLALVIFTFRSILKYEAENK